MRTMHHLRRQSDDEGSTRPRRRRARPAGMSRIIDTHVRRPSCLAPADHRPSGGRTISASRSSRSACREQASAAAGDRATRGQRGRRARGTCRLNATFTAPSMLRNGITTFVRVRQPVQGAGSATVHERSGRSASAPIGRARQRPLGRRPRRQAGSCPRRGRPADSSSSGRSPYRATTGSRRPVRGILVAARGRELLRAICLRAAAREAKGAQPAGGDHAADKHPRVLRHPPRASENLDRVSNRRGCGPTDEIGTEFRRREFR